MSILLIRHGETALNASRVLQPADTPLSVRGIAQAEALAQRLAAMNVAAIVSSDLPRALRTARAIAVATGALVETSTLLHERNFGELRGHPYDDLSINPLTMREAPAGGESFESFAHRVALAFEHVVQRRAALGGTLAVVTHGMVIRVLLGQQLRLPEGEPMPTHLGNTSVTIVDATSPYRVTLLNCTRHLAPSAQDDVNALSGG